MQCVKYPISRVVVVEVGCGGYLTCEELVRVTHRR
jgi:hypothetical protein